MGGSPVPFTLRRMGSPAEQDVQEYAMSVSSFPDGPNGAWEGQLHLTLPTDGTRRVWHTCWAAFVPYPCYDTVSQMTASDTPICITDADCAGYSLDTSNGACSCGPANVGQEAPVPAPCLGDNVCP